MADTNRHIYKSWPDKVLGGVETAISWVLAIIIIAALFGFFIWAVVFIFQTWWERRQIKAEVARDTQSVESNTESTVYEQPVITTPENAFLNMDRDARKQGQYIELQDLEAQTWTPIK